MLLRMFTNLNPCPGRVSKLHMVSDELILRHVEALLLQALTKKGFEAIASTSYANEVKRKRHAICCASREKVALQIS